MATNENSGSKFKYIGCEYDLIEKIRGKRNTLIGIILFCISLIFAFGLYTTEYNVTNDNPDIEKNISLFTGDKIDAVVVQKQIVDGDLLVFYGDRNIEDILGFTLLNKGFNGRYQITGTNYGSQMGFNIDTYKFKTAKSNYMAIGGKNYNEKIKKYNMINWDTQEITIEGKKINGDNFLHLYSLDYDYNYFRRLQALDDKGNDITKEVIVKEHESIPSSAVGKAERFMLYVYISIIIFIGYLVSKPLWENRRMHY